MIKSLKIYNFQAHRKLEIEFPPGITTIKGPTDIGKSAILRAIRWLCLNDLGGDDFISWGQAEVVAQLDLEGGRVARRKGKENVYKLNGQVFRAIGAGQVPEPISSLLGMNEINFQRQLDAHFWLSESAPEVSRQLNRVIDLAVIDESMAKAAAFVRTARERVAVTEERLIEKRAGLENAKLGIARIQSFRLLKAKYDESKAAEESYSRLEGIVTDLDSYQIETLWKRAAKMALIFDKATLLRQVERELSALENLFEALDQAQAGIIPLPDFSLIEDAWKRIADNEMRINDLMYLTTRIGERETLTELLETEQNKLWDRVKAFACPTCGRKN